MVFSRHRSDATTLPSRITYGLPSARAPSSASCSLGARAASTSMTSSKYRCRLDVLSRSPSIIQAWAANLPVGPSYAQQLLADLSGILEQAVTDSLIPGKPVKAEKIRAEGRAAEDRAVDRRAGRRHPRRVARPYKGMTDAGRYLGLRQGEIFGLSLGEIDWLHRMVHVGHQVKLFKTVTPVYGPPKGGKPRGRAPASSGGRGSCRAPRTVPAAEVTLPWQSPDARPRTFALVFTGNKGGPYNRAAFNSKIWVP
jgi:hypothetical protein